eukprot:10833024-Alexandrium_andersonii.AAC.1
MEHAVCHGWVGRLTMAWSLGPGRAVLGHCGLSRVACLCDKLLAACFVRVGPALLALLDAGLATQLLPDRSLPPPFGSAFIPASALRRWDDASSPP